MAWILLAQFVLRIVAFVVLLFLVVLAFRRDAPGWLGMACFAALVAFVIGYGWRKERRRLWGIPAREGEPTSKRLRLHTVLSSTTFLVGIVWVLLSVNREDTLGSGTLVAMLGMFWYLWNAGRYPVP